MLAVIRAMLAPVPVICVFVAVNESVRASRLRDRDHITMEEVKELEMHSTENEVSSLKAIADFSIDNSQSVDLAVSEFVSKLAETTSHWPTIARHWRRSTRRRSRALTP